jgi:hypothetical protein
MPYKGTPEEIAAKKKAYYESRREHIRLKQKEYNEKNKEKLAQVKKEYAEKNKEFVSEYQKKFREENKEKLKEYKKEYYEKNKSKIIEKNKEYQRNNPQKRDKILRKYKSTTKGKIARNASRNARRERERHASLGGVFQKEIYEIYKTCQALNASSSIKYEVDHIVPIMHDNVCGLHVPWNLSIIPAKDNRKKTNKF